MAEEPIPIPPKKKRGGFIPPYIFFPVETSFNDLVQPQNEKWIIKCSTSPAGNFGGGGGSVCCYAYTESGIFGTTQCSSYRKSNQEYINAAVAQINSNRTIIDNKSIPLRVNYIGRIYTFDGIQSVPYSDKKYYRYKIS